VKERDADTERWIRQINGGRKEGLVAKEEAEDNLTP